MAKESKRGKNPKSLANLKPIKPGEIRNPLGISRKRPYTETLQARGAELLRLTADGEAIRKSLNLPEDATCIDGVVCGLLRMALRGDLGAIREIIDRIEGKTGPVGNAEPNDEHVFLIVGQEKAFENAKPVTGSVEITGTKK